MEVRLFQPEVPLVRAPFGLWEPPEDAPLLDRSAIQLALVPAVCYDRAGYRLGFGGGYYDRWLADFSGFTVGLCRDCVLQDRVPREPHDRRVDLLLTETRACPPLNGRKKRGFAPLSAGCVLSSRSRCHSRRCRSRSRCRSSCSRCRSSSTG